VGFLGFTASGREDMARLAVRTGMTWPIGTGLSVQDLGRFGALDGAMALPGYELKPLLVVVDQGGKVVWTDGHARHKHQAPAETVQHLERALAEALGSE
jgi:hypothetical protein